MHRHSSINRYSSMPPMLNYHFHLYRLLTKKLVLTSVKGLVTLVVLVFLFPCLLTLAVSVSAFCVFQIPPVHIKPSPFFTAHVIIVENAKLFFRCMRLDFLVHSRPLPAICEY